VRHGPLRSRRPLADEVSDMIARQFILNGDVAPGELLPSEKELSDRYGVSRVTIRASIRTLREAGLISVRHGVGSVVLPRSTVLMHGLDRLCSFETFASEAGGTLTTEDVDFDEIAADAEVAEKLDVAAGASVLRVHRAKVYDGTRIAWGIDYVPPGPLPFDVIRAEFEGSVLDVMMAHTAVGVDYADLEIEPVALDGEVAERLGVPEGTVGLFMDEVVYNVDGRVVEWGMGWHVPQEQRRRFFLRRRRQVGG
jgi:DNA-binding GntR family transcriptional regulator